MTSYLDWAQAKLEAAPATACAFWIDVDQLLARRNGGGLDDAEQQPFTDGRGRQWTVVRYLANPLPARRLLSHGENQVVVWCVGTPRRGYSDLTPLEDHLGRAWHILDISLDAIAEELRPELDVPRGLSVSLKGITFDVTRYIEALGEESSHAAVTLVAAANALIRQVCNGAPGIDVSSAARVLLSSALCFTRAQNDNGLKAVWLAIESAAHVDSRYGHLLSAIRAAEPRDIIAATCVASGLARLQVPNIGQLLAAEGFCPPDVRTAFEAAAGRWSELASLATDIDSSLLSARFERSIDASAQARLRDILAGVRLDFGRIALEPMALIRLGALTAHLEEFIDSPWLACTAPTATDTDWADLQAVDAVATAVRVARSARDVQPPDSDRLEDVAGALVSSALCTASLDVARGRLAFQQLEHRLSPEVVIRMRSRLAQAEQDVRAVMARWDEAWAKLIAADVSSFLGHHLQGWKRTVVFADAASGHDSWMVVFDGLRYDLWKAIVAPALERAGWRVQPGDVSFAYLPSLTDVSRRTLIGGSPNAVRGSEAKLAQAMADRAGMESTYALRSEHLGNQKDAGGGWNVRVFSWPDKFVHSDLAGLGTLAGQFEAWIEAEFIPWMKTNVSRQARIVLSSDHGFACLDPEDAVDVNVPDDGDRNIPRVLKGVMPELGLVMTDAGQQVTIAASRRWFRSPGAHPWQFAHGGCTIHETVVPFAELAAVQEGAADISIVGLPATLELAEGEEATLEFRVRVMGGSEMFPRVSVSTNLAHVWSGQVELGVERDLRIAVTGEENLERVLVTVSSGADRKQHVVPAQVKLSKIKRATLDL